MKEAYISGGMQSATIEAENTGTEWVQIGGAPGTWCALPYSVSPGSSSVVQLHRRAIGGTTVSVISATDGSGVSGTPTLPLADSYVASAGQEYRLWVATGDYVDEVTLEIGA